MRPAWKSLTWLGIAILAAAGAYGWRVSRQPEQPGFPEDGGAGARAASATQSQELAAAGHRDQPLRSAETAWAIRQPDPSAVNLPAASSRAVPAPGIACDAAIGRWRNAAGALLELAPRGEVRRVTSGQASVEAQSAWSCSFDQAIEVRLPEGRFSGRVEPSGALALTDASGAPVAWQWVSGIDPQ